MFSWDTHKSRHMVVCQRPRKPCDAQLCYLQEPLVAVFNPLYLYNHWANLYHQIHLFYTLHIIIQPYIPNLKEIGPVVCKICVPENCPIFFNFFFATFYNSNFESTKNTLPVDRFLSNLTHL